MRVRITYFDLRQEVLDLLDLDYDADTSMWCFQVICGHSIVGHRHTAADVKLIENLDASEPQMLLLVSGATKHPRSTSVGYLAVPRNWNDPDELSRRGFLGWRRWAMDNGCFVGLDPGAFMRMLYAFRRYEGCLFVTVPDAVGDAAETLNLWTFWAPIVRAAGRSPAFVAQNGLTHDRVPWGEFGTLFIGGDDAYKEGPEAAALCAHAKSLGLWVHWGRVNGKRRYRLAQEAGADSIDGTGFSMFPDTNIPLVAEWEQDIAAQPSLL